MLIQIAGEKYISGIPLTQGEDDGIDYIQDDVYKMYTKGTLIVEVGLFCR